MWSDTVKTALLGTARATLPAPSAQTSLTALLSHLPAATPEAQLLITAGILNLYQQAGWQPPQLTPPSTVTDAPAAAVLSPPIARRLQKLLAGDAPGVLPEFLAALAAAGLHVPVELLPNVLEKGRKLLSLRPALTATIGENGRRLAAQNANWHYAAAGAAVTVTQWQAAKPIERQGLLRHLRQVDPARGLRLLQNSWKSEPDAARSRLIKLLESGLSMADEPFLEMALDDRSHLVRRKAVELLTRLPQSRLCGRYTTHSQTLLRWTPQQSQHITVQFPTTITPAMVRDGIMAQSGGSETILRQRQLIQMVTAVPLSEWAKRWQVTPAQIVRAIATTRWQRTLTTGFTNAAQRQLNGSWALAILTELGLSDRTARLLSVVDSDAVQALMAQHSNHFSRAATLHKDDPVRLLLRYGLKQASDEMILYWMQAVVAHMANAPSGGVPDPSLGVLYKQLARTCPPHLIETAVATLRQTPIANRGWQRIVDEVIDLLVFRQKMLAEIAAATE